MNNYGDTLEFKTNAEVLADKARHLPSFERLSLSGIKRDIEIITGLIGKNEGIFATYTLHNIKHIDAMLKMLDWLIPDITKEKMTSVDWLLIVLSIYFHDLGMYVSKEEFLDREKNQEFKTFVEKIYADVDYYEYIYRLENMDDCDKQVFLYQEYVRKNHALRVNQWIHGKTPYYYGESVNEIVSAIQETLKGLPKRFLFDLASICKSHEEANLDDESIFPLFERYGNEPSECANVQYAALILRTADLIHITKDRAPSTMHKLINISDIKGINAWNTHMETSSVYMKCRNFDIKDIRNHVIEIKADFSNETTFFSLTEYIAWADEQIKQSKKWADASQKREEASAYYFPWYSIVGDIRVEGNSPLPLKFELERGKLLDLLVGHTIYNDPLVAIRELLQNSIDAVRYQYYQDSKDGSAKGEKAVMGYIKVQWDSKERELIFEDNGIGMDENVIIQHLMRVGSSYYSTPDFKVKNSTFNPISRFGIGILTCFMISDDIEIFTYKGSVGHRIRMRSVHANYLLKELPKGAKELANIEPHGTKIKLKIRQSVKLENDSFYNILNYWAVLPECEILYIEDNKEPVKIGFNSIEEALKEFQVNELVKEGYVDENGIEIITIKDNCENETFELAIGVRNGYYPEKTIARSAKKSLAPGICIEGIRVSNTLPGLSSESCALLLLRGNKKIKTTVSRNGLEIDEEYIEVAKRFLKLLMRHLENEIERISNNYSTSLSQASSGGYFVYKGILEIINDKYRRYVEGILEDIPLIVSENLEQKEGNYYSERKLISFNELRNLNSFWTIESRLADNLGIISRDIGKELSYNDFLFKNAKELIRPEFNFLVFDIYEIKDKILTIHNISEVNFSKSNKQTLIKWVENIDANDLIIKELLSDVNLNKAINEFAGRYPWIYKNLRKTNLRSLIFSVKVADIKGDIKDVNVVNTRITNIYKKGSSSAEKWECIKQAIAILRRNRDFSNLTIMMMFASIYAVVLNYRDGRQLAYNNDNAADEWYDVVQQANDIVANLGLAERFSENIMDIIKGGKKSFSATRYWREWFKIE